MRNLRNKEKNGFLYGIFVPLISAVVLFCFLYGITNLSEGNSEEGKRRLEDALRRAAVACYASEGIYPPSWNYLEEHYGVQIDHSRYVVSYTVFAENLMPDITVLEK
ncbi:MAG: hypothetical protein II254_01970 [Oscillospiraceae bacterium]|nr:hypothetical protein [Oscillospiraceae bacterium]